MVYIRYCNERKVVQPTLHCQRTLGQISCQKIRASSMYTAICIKKTRRCYNEAFPYFTCLKTPRQCDNAAFVCISCHKKPRLVYVHSAQHGFCIHPLSQKTAPRICTQSATWLLHTSVVTKSHALYMHTARNTALHTSVLTKSRILYMYTAR